MEIKRIPEYAHSWAMVKGVHGLDWVYILERFNIIIYFDYNVHRCSQYIRLATLDIKAIPPFWPILLWQWRN